MTMRERMKAGMLFTNEYEGFREDEIRAKKLMKAYNIHLEPGDEKEQARLIREICGKAEDVLVEPPFYFCYGYNIELGRGTYVNMGCKFIDDGKIYVGKDVLIGPGVTISPVGHPVHPDLRGYMFAAPVYIGDRCWIGADVVICPGVTIGEGSVIGAGSVVVESIPGGVVAVGNPCKVKRPICEKDRKVYFRDWEVE